MKISVLAMYSMQKFLAVLFVIFGFALIICSGVSDALTPNDPRYSEQWALSMIKAPGGWDYETGSGSVIVAVIDQGFYIDHPELKPHIWSSNIYDSSTGQTITIHGRNVEDNNYDVSVTNGEGHGTRCAGLICSETDNGYGIAGTAWNAQIMPIKVPWAGLSSSEKDLYCAQAAKWAIDHGADIISMSYNSDNANEKWDVFEYVIAHNPDVLFVLSAGNYGRNNVYAPASYAADYPNVIAVGGTDKTDTWFMLTAGGVYGSSNHGGDVTIYAPGVDILSTDLPENGYFTSQSGTSFSTPIVAGAAALVKSQHPDYTPEQIRKRLVETGDTIVIQPYSDLDNKPPIRYAKRLNLNNALYIESSEKKITITGSSLITDGKSTKYDASPGDILPIWSVSSNYYGSIDDNGVFTPQHTTDSTEDFYIKVEAGDDKHIGWKGKYKVEIKMPVTDISLYYNGNKINAYDSIYCNIGDNLNFTTVITPSDAGNKNVSLVKDNANEGVVTWVKTSVDASGNAVYTLSPKGKGYYLLHVQAEDNAKKQSVAFELFVNGPVESVDITGDTSLKTGNSTTLTAAVTPDTYVNSKLKWTASPKGIVSLTPSSDTHKCTVTALKGGTVTITAMTEDESNVSDTHVITVQQLVEGITLEANPTTIKIGETTTVKATITPSDATDKTLKWESSKKEIASVKNGVVTAISAVSTDTKVVITATAQDGSNVSKSIAIIVTPQKVESITLDQTTAQLPVGKTLTLSATVGPKSAAKKTIKWSSSDDKVATVNKDTGEIKGVSAGHAIITATAQDGSGVSASCEVKVTVPVAGITLIYDGKEIKEWDLLDCYLGDSLEITAKVSVEDNENKDLILVKDFGKDVVIKWDKTSVDGDGNDIYTLCPTASGLFDFYAQAADGSEVKSALFELKVIAPIEKVVISGKYSLPVGMSTILTAEIDPNLYDNRNLEWSAEPEGIVSLTPGSDTLSCTVKGLKGGPVTITASAKDGHGASDTHAMTVMQKVTGITLDGKSSIRVEETTQINAVVTPDDATDPTLTWTTDNEEVATVDDKGVVTAKSAGTVKITATAADGSGKSATHTLQIKEADRELYLLNSLSESSSTIYVDDTMSLHAHYYVNDVKIEDKLVYPYQYEWTSSNPSVAEAWYIQIYRNSGGVTAISPGEADITVTVTSANGSKISSTHHVTVSPKPLIDVEVQYLHGISSTEVGNDIILNAHIMDSEYKMQMPFTWESSDSSVATVSKEFSGKATGIGIVTGHKAGTAVISVYPKDRPDSKVSVPVTFTPARTASSVVSLTLYDVPESEVIYIDDICNLAAIAKDADGNVLRDAEISWESSDTSVAAVSDSGSVSGLKRGVTTITASCLDADGNIARASAVLFVVPEDEPTFLRTNANIYLEDENERVILPLDYSSNYNAETKINVEYYDPTCSSVDDLVCPDLYAVHLFAKVKLSDII